MSTMLSNYMPVDISLKFDFEAMQEIKKNNNEHVSIELLIQHREIPEKKDTIEMLLGAKAAIENNIFSFNIVFYGEFTTKGTGKSISDETQTQCARQLYPYLRESFVSLVKQYPFEAEQLLPPSFDYFLQPQKEKTTSAMRKMSRQSKKQ